MNIDDDYDNDGNNIVPCPICLDVYCPSKEDGKCPEEDEFAKHYLNTPDTEFDSDKEVVGSDCLCVLGSKKHNPECEYATPDIEWEKVVEEFYLNFTDIEKQELDTPSWNHNGVTPYLVEQWIRTLLTSRDTYWKERVQSLMDYIEHDNQCIISQAHRGRPTNDGGYETQYGNKWYRSPNKPKCDCGLDTLLDNLK